MKEELLSVIVPIYNVEKYIKRCLNSIINQTYKYVEIICVDDGSQDSSGKIADNYSSLDNRIHVIHKENGGLVSARKVGLEKAKGKYVCYVDSDDWIERNMFKEMMGIIIRDNSDIVTSGLIRDYGKYTIDEYENIKPGLYDEACVNLLKKNMISTHTFFNSNISIHIYNKIFSKSILEEIQYNVDNRIDVGEDAACVYPCILNSNRISVSGKNFYHYCIRNDSIMGKKDYDKEKIEILLEKLYKEFIGHLDIGEDILKEYRMIEKYVKLLKMPNEVLKYHGNILVPFGQVENKSKIVIYGKGRFSDSICRWLESETNLVIIDIIDKESNNKLDKMEYDYILVAVLLANVVSGIVNELICKQIPINKILTINTKYILE